MSKKSNYLPIYLLEIFLTYSMGILGAAVSNHLLLELFYEPWIVSLISAMSAFGFLVFTLTLGHISDKYGQKLIFRILFIFKLFFHLFFLIPIKSNTHLVIFGIVNFLNGGLNGIFWPTVQSISVLAEKKGGVKEKNRFMSGYNFSWNFGFILSMILGSIFVYITNSNYQVMWFMLIGSILGLIISFIFLEDYNSFENDPQKEVSYLTGVGDTDVQNINELQNVLEKQNEKGIEKGNENINHIFEKILFVSIILILATHSLTDGAHPISVPLKLTRLGISSFWVFLLTLFKGIPRGISTTLFSHLKEEKIKNYMIISITIITFSWIAFIFANKIYILIIIMIVSGTAQGCIYALGMKIMSIKASKMNSSKPFTYFQATMSGGRMLGPLIIGFTSTISVYFGILILIVFDIVSIIQFVVYFNKTEKEIND